ncbi:hypothetical protein LMG31506_02442 [Cupriavidus yeoncheonensis]|uniref:Uncharacterized protein n=1 Tax=Cupriavidus yeoncheonensis TaxID=1462994 RepID=A0A916ITL2_9BURK|nr:hypothetical protein [Cupriavidus yeoncheonensis]CAG2140979.1 hypothetical protein LMG31506_02442 [Cupriavidus yeoncheonensis]
MPRKPAPHDPYSKLPHRIQFSPAFRALSATARALLLDVISRERGSNNGDLIVSRSIFAPMGWTSDQKLRRALEELMTAGLLIRTVAGRQRVAARYALSWLPIDKNRPHGPTMNGESRTFSVPESGSLSVPIRDLLRSQNGTAKSSYAPESGPYQSEKQGLAFPNRDRVASCQVGANENAVRFAPWKPGTGQPMTVYLAESGDGLSVSVCPSIQRTATELCDAATDPAVVLQAARRALAIATQHNAVLRLVGTAAAFAKFDPYLNAAKAEGAMP